MKQVFVIETEDGLNTLELLGCLEDTLGRDSVKSIEEIQNAYYRNKAGAVISTELKKEWEKTQDFFDKTDEELGK
jgi:hypothetical protein